MEGEFRMKHDTNTLKWTRAAAAGLTLVMLLSGLAGCGRKSEETAVLPEPMEPAVDEMLDQDNDPGTTPVDSALDVEDEPAVEETPDEKEPVDTPVSDPVEPEPADPFTPEAAAAYERVLEDNMTDLLEYRQIYTADGSGATRGIALVDIMGDETPELIFVADDGSLPRLEIYSYIDGSAVRMLRHEVWDMQKSMETLYCLYQIDGMKDLFAAKAYDENGYYHWYSEDGVTLTEESLLSPAVYDVRESSYYLNDMQITSEQYEDWLREFPQVPSQVVMYNVVDYLPDGGDARALVDAQDMDAVSMTYDEAINYIKGHMDSAPGSESAEGLPASILETPFAYFTGPRSSYMLAFYRDGSFEFKDSGVMGMSGESYEIDFVGQLEDARMVSDHICEARIASFELLGFRTDLGQTEENVSYPFREGDVIRIILPGASEDDFDGFRNATFEQMQSGSGMDPMTGEANYDSSCYYVFMYMEFKGRSEYVPFERYEAPEF